MCIPAAALPLVAAIGAGLSAVGTGFAALQANAQGKYQARIAERNAAMERQAAQIDQQNADDQAMAVYRHIGAVKGQQRLAAAAGGIALDFGTPADIAADTAMMGNEDVRRVYSGANQALMGRDIAASNFGAQASASRQAATGALIGGALDMGSTVLGGATQYAKLKSSYGNIPSGSGGIMVTRGRGGF